jgi:carbon monoxide dehydrogenase subunit G
MTAIRGVALEIDFVRSQRVAAPLDLVWNEVGSLEEFLAKIPKKWVQDVVPGSDSAQLLLELAWGPVKWAFEGTAALEAVTPREHVLFVIEVENLMLRFDGSLDLYAVAGRETNMSYRGHMECRHRFASKMRGMLGDVVEEHVHRLMGRVKDRAERRYLARERLLP